MKKSIEGTTPMKTCKKPAFYTLKQDKENGRVDVSFLGSPESDGCCRDFLDKMKEIYNEERKFKILFDASKLGRAKLRHLKIFAKFMKINKQCTQDYMVCAAIVAPSPMAKAAIKLLFKLRKPVTEVTIWKSESEANDYLKQKKI